MGTVTTYDNRQRTVANYKYSSNDTMSFEPPPPCTPAERRRAEELGRKLQRAHFSKMTNFNPHKRLDGVMPIQQGNSSHHGETKVAQAR